MNRISLRPGIWAPLLLSLGLVACGSGGDKATDGAATDEATNGLQSAINAVKDTASDAANAVGDAAKEATDAAGAMADGAADMAGQAAQSVGDAASAATDAAGNAVDAVGDAAGAAVDQAKDVASAAADTASDVASAAADTASAAADKASDAANAAVGAAAGAVDSAKDVAAAVVGDGPCALSISAGDGIAYSTNALTAPSSCDKVTVTLTHTGKLPKAAMGHNWVLLPADVADTVAAAGMSVGVDGNYVPDDDRIVAATALVGGGESASVTVDLAKLESGKRYVYVCTFPGHWTIMKGTFSVS